MFRSVGIGAPLWSMNIVKALPSNTFNICFFALGPPLLNFIRILTGGIQKVSRVASR